MLLVESEVESVRNHLEGVLKSPRFVRNERLSSFLRFIVERHLNGRGSELKESVIGVEVFGRKPDYNPKFDPIVRIQARLLRTRLAEYYAGEGSNAEVVIEIPKGGYVPLIHSVQQAAKSAAPGQPAPSLRLGRWAAVSASVVLALAIVGWMRIGAGGWQLSKSSAEVRSLYLRARAFETTDGIQQSIDLFQQAIAKDPSFAPPYAGVAAGEAIQSAFDRFTPAERAAMIGKGWTAANKAIELDSSLADAYDGRAMMQARQAQWRDAERSFRRAVELSPRDPLWRDHFAMYLLVPLGRIDEALDQLHIAEELDPALRQTHKSLSRTLRYAGRFDEAEGHCQKAAANDQEASACWAETLLRQGKVEQAVQILERVWQGNLLRMGAEALGVAYARAGRRHDAERIAALVPRPASKAVIFAALGDNDRTFETLDQMVPMGPTRLGRDVLTSPDFACLRSDPRLKTLRRKLGLPE